MKVLLVNRSLPYHVPGGLERHVEDLALGLADAGVEVTLLSAPLPEAERRRLADLGLRTEAVPVDSPRRYSLQYLRAVAARLEDVLKGERFDLIHAQEFALGFWSPTGGAPPVVLSVHGTITSETPLHPGCRRGLLWHEWPWALGRFGRRFIYAPIWRRHLRAAARLLVDSAFTHGELERIIPQRRDAIRRLPLGVRETGPEPPDHAEARRRLGWQGTQLLTIGRLEWQKGQTLALESLAGLRGRDWHYTVVGIGSRERQVHRCVQSLDLGSRVTLVGRVDEPTKHAMLAGADLFVWPERTHPAFGLVGLEALLHNTPLLGPPLGAIPELLDTRGGWLAEAATAGALRDALDPLLADPARLRAPREGMRGWALERFAFDRMIAATVGHYEEVLAERGSAECGTRNAQ